MNACILFDFDGTIMDTEPAIMASYGYLFEKYRTIEEFTPERRIRVLGPALEVMMAEFFPEKDPFACVEEYRAYQKNHLRDLIHPMPGAVRLLKELREMGIPRGTVSTRYRKSLEELLEQNDMRQYMDVVLGHDDVVNDKPDPEGILLAKKMLGCDDCMYIGDSVMDVRAGKNAGAFAVAFPSNPGKRDALFAETPDAVIASLDELTAIVRRWRKTHGTDLL